MFFFNYHEIFSFKSNIIHFKSSQPLRSLLYNFTFFFFLFFYLITNGYATIKIKKREGKHIFLYILEGKTIWSAWKAYIYIHDEQSLVIDNETVKMIGGKRGISFPERIVRYRVFVTVMDGQDKNLRMFLARVHPSTKKTIRLGYLAARSYG